MNVTMSLLFNITMMPTHLLIFITSLLFIITVMPLSFFIIMMPAAQFYCTSRARSIIPSLLLLFYNGTAAQFCCTSRMQSITPSLLLLFCNGTAA
jgi:hypothetical protein